MEDICNFLPKKNNPNNIEYHHFVYEASFKRLKQPFFFTKYCAFLVFKGEGVLKAKSEEHRLKPGTLFFAFPKSSIELVGSNNFTYLYITFYGDGAKALLDGFGVNEDNYVFDNHEQLTSFWMNSIRRITPVNSIALTESVLLYSLSFIEDTMTSQKANKFESILGYINENFSDPTLSLKKVADIHFYSEKYLSSLFLKNTGVKFTEYLNKLRITHAISIINQTAPISEVATKCGYSDPLYFSKVFKRITGKSPSEYTKGCKAQD